MIEIDDEVFAFLQAHARPLIDTPNNVLRSILLGDVGDSEARSITPNISESRLDEGSLVVNDKDKSLQTLIREEEYRKEFCDFLLQNEFGGGFEKVRGYRWMFESTDKIVYFQNFNKSASRIWYRLHAGALERLRGTNKRTIICFTNPLEAFAYRIPFEEIEKKIEAVGWSRDSIEVNIDHEYSKWLELKWNISEFLGNYDDWKLTR